MTIYNCDCRDGLAMLLEADSVDSIVCDPPYELGFMGKSWDSTGIANDPAMWREALRVLKPGGHLLAFSGTRTYHRMVCAIEDAGFEIRDQIGWVFGSGFPKSLDVAAAIDKQDATEARRARQLRFTEWVRGTGLTSARIDELTGTNMGGHYTTAASQPAVATREHFEQLRPYVGAVPAWVEALVDERTVESENFKAREVTGQQTKARSTAGSSALPTVGGDTVYKTWDTTRPHTPEAQQWQGWGTALKPAWEPIAVARKPLIGTVAANVLTYGTGAINIDGCRVGTTSSCAASDGDVRTESQPGAIGAYGTSPAVPGLGRWPANLIHDGSEEVLACFPETKSGALSPGMNIKATSGWSGGSSADRVKSTFAPNEGSAARFFYCAKASKAERGAGNTHPTVKPVALMRYLLRLVTQPGGLAVDPFTGSGSTSVAAAMEGFQFVGFELSAEYVEIARARVAAVTK